MNVLELVERIRTDRDAREAQAELYLAVRERLLERLRAKITGRVRPRLDAEDVLHEALLRVLGALDRFESRSEQKFFAWVYRIAKNLIRDQYDRRSAGVLHFAADEAQSAPQLTHVAARQRRPESQLQRREWIESILAQLKEKEAEVIRLHKLESKSFAEIASAWKKTPGAVQRFYSRAADRFRQVASREA